MSDKPEDIKSASAQLNEPFPNDVEELVSFIQQTLEEVQNKFQAMSLHVLTTIDGINGRLDELEKNLADLVAEANVSAPDKP